MIFKALLPLLPFLLQQYTTQPMNTITSVITTTGTITPAAMIIVVLIPEIKKLLKFITACDIETKVY